MVDVRQGRYVLKDPEQRPRPLGQAVVASSRGDGPRDDVAHVGETGCIEAGAGTRSSFASKAGSREAGGRRAARRQRGKALRCARRPGVGESGSANAPGSKRSAKQRRDRRRGLARHGARNGAVRKQLTGAHWCLRQRPVSLVGRKGQLDLSKAWRGVPDARHGADQLARALGHGRSARGAYARGGRHVVAGRWCKGQERGSALGPRGEPLVSAQARLHVHRGRRARRRRNDLVAGGSGRPRSGCHAPRSPADGVGPSTEAAARAGRAGGESQQVRVPYLWQSRIGPQRLWRRTATARALLLRTPPRKPRQAGPVLAHLLAGCSCCHPRLPGPVGAGLTQSPVVQRAAH